MNIYITRHGQTVWNKEGRVQGNKNSDLTNKGIQDAKLLSERMEDIYLDYIIASPIERAYKTAQIVKGNKKVDIIKCNSFKEINCGDFEGEKFENLPTKFPTDYYKIKENPFVNKYPNGENLIEFYDRVVDGFKNAIDKYKEKNILIVGHGGTIKCIEAYIKGDQIKKGWFENVVFNCSFTHLKVINNNIETVAFNDKSHLENIVETA